MSVSSPVPSPLLQILERRTGSLSWGHGTIIISQRLRDEDDITGNPLADDQTPPMQESRSALKALGDLLYEADRSRSDPTLAPALLDAVKIEAAAALALATGFVLSLTRRSTRLQVCRDLPVPREWACVQAEPRCP